MQKKVLSVEDDGAAYHLLEIAIHDLGNNFKLFRTVDGEQGIAFLKRNGSYSDMPKPDLILLNLNLPRMNGFDVLEAMQKDNSIHDIPVVVFSWSSLNADRESCFGSQTLRLQAHRLRGLHGRRKTRLHIRGYVDRCCCRYWLTDLFGSVTTGYLPHITQQTRDGDGVATESTSSASRISIL